MKKLMALLLAVMMLSTCLLVAACGGACKDGHTDANHDGVCDECATGDLEVKHEWKYTSGTKTGSSNSLLRPIGQTFLHKPHSIHFFLSICGT